MKEKSFKILSPCGILGYGFPDESFNRAIEMSPDAIVVDAGSTDAGPHKLGAGVAIVSKMAAKKDLRRIITAGYKLGIPVIIGSAGGSGGEVHVKWTLAIIDEILREEGIKDLKQAIVWADIPKAAVREAMRKGEVVPLGTSVPQLEEKALEETTAIVAQMGIEPIIKALESHAGLIICGRAYDPAPFAAVGVYNGYPKALSYHMGKVLECGALCCNPGTTKDCMMGELFEDHFDVYPADPRRKCNTTSVAAHTFYEKDHPFILHGPGIIQDLERCTFVQKAENRVSVYGSDMRDSDGYWIKLEGARLQAYRTFVIAGVRDPILISKLDEVEKAVQASVEKQYEETDRSLYTIMFYNYGINAVMGDLEPLKDVPHEVGVLFQVVASTQEIASAICASLRSTFMHYGYEGRKATAGNLAFPFAPSDVEFGKVFEFSVYHLMKVSDPCSFFPLEARE
jgi:hypothetical protein